MLLQACRTKKKRKIILVLSWSKITFACLSPIENVRKYKNFTGNYFTCGKEPWLFMTESTAFPSDQLDGSRLCTSSPSAPALCPGTAQQVKRGSGAGGRGRPWPRDFSRSPGGCGAVPAGPGHGAVPQQGFPPAHHPLTWHWQIPTRFTEEGN